ncbi:MAG: hypothetical protein NT141_00495 [candidate division WWE3 bacterium]|nr:hypothetical protein [candidate division WWE3 bacterium]
MKNRIWLVAVALFVLAFVLSASEAGGEHAGSARPDSFVPVIEYVSDQPIQITYYDSDSSPKPVATAVPTAVPTMAPLPTAVPTSEPTAGVIPTRVPQVAEQAQAQVQVVVAPKIAAPPAAPTSAPQRVDVKVLPIVGQHQSHLSTCEASAAAAVLAASGGGSVSFWEDLIVRNTMLANNPTDGFWGALNGDFAIDGIPPITPHLPDQPIDSYVGPSYGIHAGALAPVIASLASNLVSVKVAHLNFLGLRQELDAGNPVEVWVVNTPPYNWKTRILADGTVVHAYEHTVLVIGYGYTEYADGSRQYSYKVIDPSLDTVYTWRDEDDFYRGTWQSAFGGMSLVFVPKVALR